MKATNRMMLRGDAAPLNCMVLGGISEKVMLTLRPEAGASHGAGLVMRVQMEPQKARGQVREETAMIEEMWPLRTSTQSGWPVAGDELWRRQEPHSPGCWGSRGGVRFARKCPEAGGTRLISRRAVITAGLHENDNEDFWEWPSQNSVGGQVLCVRQEETLSTRLRKEFWAQLSFASVSPTFQTSYTSHTSPLQNLVLCTCSLYSPEVLSLIKSLAFPSTWNELLHIPTCSTLPGFLKVSAQISHYQRGFLWPPNPKKNPLSFSLSLNPPYSALCIFIFLHSNNHYMAWYIVICLLCVSCRYSINF